MIESFHLYLSGGQAQLRRRYGWPWKSTVHELHQWGWNVSDPSTLMLPILSQRRLWKPRLYVYVGSAICRFMAAALPAQLRDMNERRAAAQAQMLHQLGLSGADWSFTLDQSSEDGVSIICAVPSRFLERVQALAFEHGLNLASVTPFVANVWNVLEQLPPRQAECGLIAVERDAFSVIVKRAGKQVWISALLHQCEPDLVDREIRRLCYSLGVEAQECIRIVIAEGTSVSSTLYVDKILPRESRSGEQQYADFRDLLFSTPELRKQ